MQSIFMLPCIRKVFTELHFFHILICHLKSLHTIPHNDKVKETFAWNSWIFIKTKREKHDMYRRIGSLCSILCWSIFGSNHSSLRLERCTAVLITLQRWEFGLWLGRVVHSCVVLAVCLQLLSCLKINLRPSLRSRALRSRLSSRQHSSLPD